MHSETEIRQAIVERIQAVLATPTPAPLVLGRDITGLIESGATPNELRDGGNPPLIHAITVTQLSMLPVEQRPGGTLYDLIYEITQWKQYRSGTDTSNSDKEASLERDAIINAFRYRGELPAILNHAHVKPIEWPARSLNRPKPIPGGQVWVSTAILRAQNFYGPVSC